MRLIGKFMTETTANVRLKNRIQDFLEADYEPSGGVKRIANEFHNTALIKKKIDGEMITPNSLAKYIKQKFNLGTKEINGCIEGWFYGDYNRETGMRKK